MRFKISKKLRVIVLVHTDLVPPDSIEGLSEKEMQPWKTEYDVISTLKSMGHEVQPLGLYSDLGVIGKTLEEHKPHVALTCLKSSTASPCTISTSSVF